jgi:hypothetical protein
MKSIQCADCLGETLQLMTNFIIIQGKENGYTSVIQLALFKGYSRSFARGVEKYGSENKFYNFVELPQRMNTFRKIGFQYHNKSMYKKNKK